MITVSSTIRNLLKTKHRQVVRITVGNTGLTLTGEHIAQDGLSIDRYCASGSTLELGSAISAELTLKLLNFDGSFDNVTFEGQELKVEQGVVDGGNTYWFDMGYFKVDTPPRKKSTISITALDRMVKFDESAYAWSATQTYPMTVAQMVSAVCQRCYVTLATNLSNLPNANVSIPKDPVISEETTFRNIIQWASAIMGTCAYINESGQLVFGWISNTDINITPEYRYQGADLWEGNVTITGYTFSTTIETETEDDVTTEDVTYYSGTLEYPIDLSANPLVASAPQTILDTLYSAIGTITYRPFECTTIPFPYIMPLDRITYTDPNGNEISTLVTNVVHNLNLGSAIAGKGDTETTKGYSTGTGFTPSQTKELTKTQILIEQASAAATSAQASADSAHASAVSANNSANSALNQLSIVEDVAGTLRWISENGDFVLTEDDTVHPGTVYFIYENGEYVPITNPDPTKNPSEEGWYILDVTDSQASFIMAHLAVTDAGLWILPVNQLVSHNLVDSADNNLVDSDDNQLVDYGKDDENIHQASGYKVLISGETTDNHPVGVSIYNGSGDLIANYGETTTIGNALLRNVYIDSNAVYIKNGSKVLAKYGEDVELGENGDVHIGTVSNGYIVESFDGLQNVTNPSVTVGHTINSIISIQAICLNTSTGLVETDVNVTSADYTISDKTITFNRPLTGTTLNIIKVSIKYSTSDKITQLSIGTNHSEVNATNFPLIIGNNNPNLSPGDVFQVNWDGQIYTEGHSDPIGTIVKASTNFDTIYTPGIDMYSNYAEMTLNKGTWVVFAQFGVMPSGNVTGCLALRFCKGGRSSEYVVDQARQLGNVNTGYYSAINATTIMNIEYNNTSVYAIASCHYDGTVSARNFKAIRIS